MRFSIVVLSAFLFGCLMVADMSSIVAFRCAAVLCFIVGFLLGIAWILDLAVRSGEENKE